MSGGKSFYQSRKEIGAGMKTLLILLISVVCVRLSSFGATETAQARLFCRSLRFQQATADDLAGFQWRMNLTTLNVGINGELALDFSGSGYSHWSYTELYSEWYDYTDTGGWIAFNVPNGPDANGDGIPDFWEVSQSVNGLTGSGGINSPAFGINSGFSASWYRPAGSATGTCYYSIPDPLSGGVSTLDFAQTFELIEYDGPLNYTPGSTAVNGTVYLTQASSGKIFAGAVQFLKESTNRLNDLTLQDGTWTNGANQTLNFYWDTVERQSGWPTNYWDYGLFQFVDGDPNTLDQDYLIWGLIIVDTNDTDHNGIPDFSDDPAVVGPPSRPTLTLARQSGALLLTIHGDSGHVHLVQESASLFSPSWQTVVSTNLTGSQLGISLPLPTQTKYWRVLAE
jgi:hypothetical protein